MRARLVSSIALIVLGASVARAQISERVRRELHVADSSQVQEVELVDGSRLIGRFIAVGERSTTFRGSAGDILLDPKLIARVHTYSRTAIHGNELWFADPNSSRLFLAPTGRTLAAGDGYFADHELFFPQVAYGVTDRVMVSGGISLFPCSGACAEIGYFAPKVALVRDSTFNLAAGALLAKAITSSGDGGNAGTVYLVGTSGHPDASVTYGVAAGFVDGHWYDRPFIMLGGNLRVSRRIALITENYFVPGAKHQAVSGGVRFLGEKISVDLALANVIPDGFFPGLPLVGFVVKF
ncbi:MAG: hypothetical protein ABJD07_10040 [Gemmatimonadaceae bacterium]